MKAKRQPPPLGARVRASGYMVPYSSVRAWREAHPDAATIWPEYGVKGLKRVKAEFAGFYAGMRTRKIKWWRRWQVDAPEPDVEWECADVYITLWLVVYSTRAKPRYVLPGDVEIVG